MDPTTWAQTLNTLWEKSVTLLFALSGICIVLLILLIGGVLLGLKTSLLATAGLPLIMFAVLCGGLGVAKWYETSRTKTFNVVVDRVNSFWHRAPQTDGIVSTQITLDFTVTNLTTQGLRLLAPTLKRPWAWGAKVFPSLMIANSAGPYAEYAHDVVIPNQLHRQAGLTFVVLRDIGWGKRMTVAFTLEDQRGNRQRIEIKRVEGR